MPLGDFVLVEWVDSSATPGWTRDEPNESPLICQSVGWLTVDGPLAVTVTAHRTDDDPPQRAGEMTIPREAIRNITTFGDPTRLIYPSATLLEALEGLVAAQHDPTHSTKDAMTKAEAAIGLAKGLAARPAP